MIICGLQQISKMFGGEPLFENLSLEVHEGSRIGLVGSNGSGKSTILKMIAREETVDSGNVILKKDCKVGYLAQIPLQNQQLVSEVLLSAFESTLDLAKEISRMEYMMKLEKNEEALLVLLQEYGALQDQFDLLDGYEVEASVAKVAEGLGITGLLDSPYEALSGGEKTKVALGKVLLLNPNLLLLDEPTNHLDIAAVEWLEQYLKDYRGTVVIVSHDRFFLDQVVTTIIDVEDGEAILYHHNYSGFVKEKEKRLLDEFQSFQEQQKKIKKMKEAIKRLREWANQASPPSEALHKRATNMERALERMEKLKRPILERKKIALQLESGDRSGKDVITLKGAEKSYHGRSLFSNVSLTIQYKNRTAIVGNNGTGKSTLLKVIIGEESVDSGSVHLGANVKIGYLSQALTVTSNKTVLEAFREEVLVSENEARHILAKFLFYGPAVFRKTRQLSGGERMRLRLAQLMHQEINLLILDEPTNHLDIDSREVLEEALEHFQGTIIAVSHDRYLLNKLFDKTYWLHDGQLHIFEGNYSWAREKLQVTVRSQTERKDPIKLKHSDSKSQMVKQVTSDEIEKEVEEVERQLTELEKNMDDTVELKDLQLLYEQQIRLKVQRDTLYKQLETCME